ncbi:hypothetical protein HPP92_005175 [Vanilla planifolia]|uniref:FLZ-type domain-containing protein n=1 Tax=Vanilla planifolia TaxID=51239 RepID=A0A835RTW9_VANPL|nr:hypothetical protein HPP92_005175 [Vanilla planifolia]
MNSSKEELVEDGQIDFCTADATLLTHKNPKSSSDVFALGLKSSPLGSLPFIEGRPSTNNLSGSLPASVETIHGIMGYLSASEMELSEDYTCIISHGTNPKTTHIFGDCILKSYTIEASDSNTKKLEESGSSNWIIKCLEDSPTFGSGNFLSFCFFCHKNLEDGKDIYMYRGEKAFCSCKCRDQLMLIEEKWESEKLATSSS